MENKVFATLKVNGRTLEILVECDEQEAVDTLLANNGFAPLDWCDIPSDEVYAYPDSVGLWFLLGYFSTYHK